MRPASKLKSKIVVPLIVGLAGFAFSATPALAAPPENPETVNPATGITATEATLHGVLNPVNAGAAGSYDFSYEPSSSLAPECGIPGTLAPSSPVADAGAKGEAKSVTLAGLEPNKEYAFCIVAYSLSAEPAYGAAVPFTTLALPPEVASESTSGVTSTGATLEAQINPNNEATSYTFEYSTTKSGANLTGAIVKVPVAPPAALEGGTIQTVAVPTEVLVPDTTYFYRVVAENEKSEEEVKPVKGSIESFTSAPEAPTTSTPAKSVTETTAVLEGVLNPKANAKAGWYFAYSTGSTCTEPAAGSGETTHEPEATVDAATETKSVTNLEPSQKYTFCLVATNAAGTQTTVGNPVTLETKAAAPEVGGESESGESPFEATLEAQINPNNQTTTYSFEYATSAVEIGTATAITLKGLTLSGYGDQTATVSTGHHLTPNTTYYFRVLATNPNGTTTDPTIEHFATPVAVAPKIESETSSVQSPFAATLEATVNPEYQATTCVFEYSTNASLPANAETKTVPCNPEQPLGSGGAGVGTSAALTGLSSATKYYFRLAAKNGAGETKGTEVEPIKEFTTATAEAPAVESESVPVLTATAATLRALVNPDFQTTTYVTEYATEAALLGTPGATTVPGASLPPAGSSQPVFVELAGLQPNTPYFYHVVATNNTGTFAGAIETFTTSIAPTLTTGGAQGVTATTALLSGTVNPEGAETSYHFAYIAQAGYEAALAQSSPNPYALGFSTPALELAQGGVPDTSDAPQTLPLTTIRELQPATIYHFALVATNTVGTTVTGPDQTFTTAAATAPTAGPTVTPPGETTPPAATPPAAFPFLSYPSIAALNAREAKEAKSIPAGAGPTPLTNAQKLTKALKACHKKKGGKRTSCERAAHKKFGSAKKKK